MQQVKLPSKVTNELFDLLNSERDLNNRIHLLKDLGLNNPKHELIINGYIQCLVSLDIIEFLDKDLEGNENA